MQTQCPSGHNIVLKADFRGLAYIPAHNETGKNEPCRWGMYYLETAWHAAIHDAIKPIALLSGKNLASIGF